MGCSLVTARERREQELYHQKLSQIYKEFSLDDREKCMKDVRQTMSIHAECNQRQLFVDMLLPTRLDKTAGAS